MRLFVVVLFGLFLSGNAYAQEVSRRDLREAWNDRMDDGPYDEALSEAADAYGQNLLEDWHPRRVARIFERTAARLDRENSDPVLTARNYRRSAELLFDNGYYDFAPDRQMIDRGLAALRTAGDGDDAFDERMRLLALRAQNWDFGDGDRDSSGSILAAMNSRGLNSHLVAPDAARMNGLSAYFDGDEIVAASWFVASWIYADRMGENLPEAQHRMAEAWGRAAIQGEQNRREAIQLELVKTGVCSVADQTCIPSSSNRFGFTSPYVPTECMAARPPVLRPRSFSSGYDLDAVYLIEFDVDVAGRVQNEAFLYPSENDRPHFTVLRTISRLDFPARTDPSRCQNMLALIGFSNVDIPLDPHDYLNPRSQ
jgi:hypothetical protein